MKRLLLSLLVLCSVAPSPAEPKPVPKVQAIPLPRDEVSFQRNGEELTRFYFGKDFRRPFVYPVTGPSGRSLTRMGHPRDPESHSHHNSVWISHEKVQGSNFWTDNGGQVVHQRILRIEDGDELAYVETENAWVNREGVAVMHDRSRVAVRMLGNLEWLLLLDLELHAKDGEITLEETPFGLLGVRMAKTIGAHDGGGTIRNSEGGVGEVACFRKPARWMDYSGPVTGNVSEGITLFDHPGNPHHPTAFHCRDDGWMGVALTFQGALKVTPEKPLRLRYALWVHSGIPETAIIEEQWKTFSTSHWLEFPAKK